MSKQHPKCARITSASYTPQAGDSQETCGNRGRHYHEEIDKWYCHSCETFLYNSDGSLKQTTIDSYGGCEEYNVGGD
jgi:methionyl-tRNA synthetase